MRSSSRLCLVALFVYGAVHAAASTLPVAGRTTECNLEIKQLAQGGYDVGCVLDACTGQNSCELQSMTFGTDVIEWCECDPDAGNGLPKCRATLKNGDTVVCRENVGCSGALEECDQIEDLPPVGVWVVPCECQ